VEVTTNAERLGTQVLAGEVRFNAGYRREWMSIGVVVHGVSPQPGHGPGATVIITGPGDVLLARTDADGHRGLSEQAALQVANALG